MVESRSDRAWPARGVWATAGVLVALAACCLAGCAGAKNPSTTFVSSGTTPASRGAMVTGGLSTSASPAVSPQANGSAAPVYIAEAHWADGEDGPTLVVVPSDAAREARGSSTAGEAGWLQLESLVDGLAEHPAKDRLRHQYICHQQFASIAEPDKATWELEVERPDVGYPATVAARCNPVQ